MAENRKLFLDDGTPRYIQCRDAGAELNDRYTVWFTGRHRALPAGRVAYRAMSDRPFHPLGFGVWGEQDRRDCRGYPGGKRIGFSDLPPDCRRLVLDDYRTIWRVAPTAERSA